MALPPAIQAQIDAANETLQVLNAPRQDPQPPAPADLHTVAQHTDPPQEPQEPEPQPPTEPSPAPSPSPQPPKTPSNDEATWEQRFKTLQGLFNAKVPGLQKQVETLQSDLQAAIARLNAASEVTKPPPADPLQSREHAADVEAFGSDLVEMVQRVIDRKVDGAVRDAQTQLQALAARVTQVEEHLKGTSQAVVASAEDRFYDRLTVLVPDWEQTNADPAFLAWLAEVDSVYGQPRQAALTAAQQALDADRAAAVFRAFVSTKPQPPAKPQVERQVSPRASAATPPPQPANKPVFTEKQIAEFYDAKRRGQYRGKEEEAARIELVINQAIAEGRVV